jgi:hypothetical protein
MSLTFAMRDISYPLPVVRNQCLSYSFVGDAYKPFYLDFNTSQLCTAPHFLSLLILTLQIAQRRIIRGRVTSYFPFRACHDGRDDAMMVVSRRVSLSAVHKSSAITKGLVGKSHRQSLSMKTCS